MSLLATVATLTFVADSASAAMDPSTGLYFSTSGTEATISGFTTCVGSLNIPEQVLDGATAYTVTAIDQQAFLNCGGLTAVTLPDSIISIGNEAFRDSGLTSVTLGAGVTTIGTRAFAYTNLTSLAIPDSVTTIDTEAFSHTALTTVTLGSGVTTIDTRAFAYTNLTSLAIPDSVTTIGTEAFRDTALTTVTIGSGVTTIDTRAFAYIPALTSFTFEGSPPTPGSTVFSNSGNLTEVLHRPSAVFPATWGGKPTRTVYRPPSAPTSVTATPGDTHLTVAWTAPSSSDATISAYTATAQPGARTCTWSSGPLTCIITGLTNDTPYSVDVVATSIGGTSPSTSALAPVTPRAIVIPPPPPTTTTATTTTTTTTTPPEVAPATTITPSIPPDTAASTEPGVPEIPSIDVIARLPIESLLASATLRPGATITLTRAGFEPDDIVQVILASNPRILATASADSEGRVTITTTLPGDVTAGEHTLALYAPGSARGARQAVAIVVGLPSTGPLTTVPLLAAVVLGGLGLAISVARRGHGVLR